MISSSACDNSFPCKFSERYASFALQYNVSICAWRSLSDLPIWHVIINQNEDYNRKLFFILYSLSKTIFFIFNAIISFQIIPGIDILTFYRIIHDLLKFLAIKADLLVFVIRIHKRQPTKTSTRKTFVLPTRMKGLQRDCKAHIYYQVYH